MSEQWRDLEKLLAELSECLQRLQFQVTHPKRYGTEDDQADYDAHIEDISLGGRRYRGKR